VNRLRWVVLLPLLLLTAAAAAPHQLLCALFDHDEAYRGVLASERPLWAALLRDFGR